MNPTERLLVNKYLHMARPYDKWKDRETGNSAGGLPNRYSEIWHKKMNWLIQNLRWNHEPTSAWNIYKKLINEK